MKKLILLDFDHTVFNTTRYVNVLKKRFKDDFGISSKEFHAKRDALKKCCVVVDIDKFIASLSHPDKEAMHGAMIDIIEQHAQEFVFSDVHDFIEKHKDRFYISIATHGDAELQTEKISHSNLSKEVGKIISRKQKEKVVEIFLKEYDEIWFIDDKPKNVERVKKAHPQVHTYLVVRPEDHPYAGSTKYADHIVDGLNFVIT